MPFKLKQLNYTYLHKLLPGSEFIGAIQLVVYCRCSERTGIEEMAISMKKQLP